MRQADPRVANQRHHHDTGQRPRDHFQYTGCDRKNRKSHALNGKAHGIDQHQKAVTRRREYQELVRIRNNLCIRRIQEQKRELLSGQKHKDEQHCRDHKSEQ